MPLYIPWLTDTIKKRGVRYLLHHYLGQFFEEKLTLEQLSIDIYEGKGSIRNLSLDVNGLNDELDFLPFTFLDGCLIGQISVEVPWSSLVTDACRVELDGARFFCRLKTSADAAKHHCTESTLLSRSLMTSSMQMAEEIVTTEDDDESQTSASSKQDAAGTKKKDVNQMFEGLEMFAQLIDSVLRRTKLTARNTLFQIEPHNEKEKEEFDDSCDEPSRGGRNLASSRSSGDEFSEPMAKSDTDDEENQSLKRDKNQSKGTVEFFIKFFGCEEMIDQTRADLNASPSGKSDDEFEGAGKSPIAIPETITKVLTLEDVEMRIDGVAVSNLIGKHTTTIKFNGQKSEIAIFSGSPLLAVISHEQLETFFNVFDGSRGQDLSASIIAEQNQKLMSPEDYAKIENQLFESASFRNMIPKHTNKSPYYSNPLGRPWGPDMGKTYSESKEPEPYGCSQQSSEDIEPTLDHIEAFSCELKLPGIWLCILRAGEALPPLIKPYADSFNSFQTINKYIDKHIKVPHIRCLALKVALDITAAGTNIFLGDLDVTEHLQDSSRMSPILSLIHNDHQTNAPITSSRYKASISNGRDITIDLLTKTRVMFDPTIIDRVVFDYRLIKMNNSASSKNPADLNLTLRGNQFKVELLCPIPDLTPEAHKKPTQLRPQSFIFDFEELTLAWQSDKLIISSNKLLAYVKTQPMQGDNEAVKFLESTSKGSDKISLVLEPSPSNLDNAFSNDVEQALNESSMYDSIYVSQATESRLPTDPFQTKRKLVRASNKPNGARLSECDHEKILTPGDRQHLLDYLNQTLLATRLSLNLQLPVCDVEFEDKEQLDLIYNRFGNDFVFWQPKAFTRANAAKSPFSATDRRSLQFKRPRKTSEHEMDEEEEEDDEDDDDDIDNGSGLDHRSASERHGGSQHSLRSTMHIADTSQSERYDNEVTCKIIVDELFVRFNHQSCAAALKQEINAKSLLLGIIIDVDKRPNTLLSIVADNLELSTDLETVLEGNYFGDKNSVFALTAEIKRPTKLLKDIKLAIQLKSGLFNDFRTETYTRFWQSINVTDEPILGYSIPQIVTELHIDILNTCLLLVREDARPALLSVDELYMTSMVMEETSQVMIRLIADEMSLYMKRDKQGLEIMKNYICLIDSGLIDLDVRFGQDDRLEFGVINNVITVRVCQDSLSALCKLFNVLIRKKSVNGQQQQQTQMSDRENLESEITNQTGQTARVVVNRQAKTQAAGKKATSRASVNDRRRSAAESRDERKARRRREMNLLEDAMNDYSIAPSGSAGSKRLSAHLKAGECALGSGGGGIAAKALAHKSERSGAAIAAPGEKRSQVEENGQVEDKSSAKDVSRRGSNGHASSSDCDASDSDVPPMFPRAASTSSSSTSSASSNEHQRDPNACLLDESNPMLGDMFSQPLMPSSGEKLREGPATSAPGAGGDDEEERKEQKAAELERFGHEEGEFGGSNANLARAMDESGFFVIGDDDVGAGIIDKRQQEPVVRKLIDGPINIIENHFKMTRPRTIPETLANSLERYVLEEMTLVVNLFGGHDFDDDDTPPTSANDDSSSNAQASDTTDQASEATNELLDTISAESQLIRSRAGSLAGGTRRSTVGSLKRPSSGAGKLGGRRKHLSESAGPGARADEAQRVRFGEGAVNLWESLDLMSSPDFLGARSRPGQPPLNSDLKQAGGTWRENDVCIQLTLSKVKLLYEAADCSRAPGGRVDGEQSGSCKTTSLASGQQAANGVSGGATAPIAVKTTTTKATAASDEPNLRPPISWRFMLFIQEIEVKDRIAASDINKMLYEYCTESMPKRSTPMLAIKNIATINPSDGCEECDLRVSLKPLRLNIDQDTLLFLIEFCTTFCKALTKQQQQLQLQAQSSSSSAAVYPSVGGAAAPSGRSSRNSLAAEGGGGGGPVLPANPVNPVDETNGSLGSAGRAGRPQRPTYAAGEAAVDLERRSETTPATRPDVKNNRPAWLAGGKSQSFPSDGPAPRSGAAAAVAPTTASLSAPHATSRRLAAETAGSGGNSGRTTGPEVHNRDITIAAETITDGVPATARAGANWHVDIGRNQDRAAAVAAEEEESEQEDEDEEEEEEDYWESSEEIEGDDEGAPERRAGGNQRSSDSESGHEESEDEDTIQATKTTPTTDGPGAPAPGASGAGKRALPTHCHTDELSGPANRQPIYIKSFTFSPDVPIRIDYHAKHLDFEQGALAGILLGLAHLDHSELILRRVQAKHGMRGLDRVLLFAINSWLSDIKRNQLPSILGGVGPMHSVIQLFQGMRDLVWMPIDHYRKDGRLVRGLQRGASSFSSSTAMAAINLVNRFISIVQCTAQIAHDIVTPPSLLDAHLSSSSSAAAARHRRRRVAKGGAQLASAPAGAGSSSSSGLGSGLASGRRARQYHSRHSLGQDGLSNSHGVGSSLLSGGGGGSGVAAGGLNQPRNFCEGVAVGFNILKEGLNDTARNVTVGMQAEDTRSAVGELVRQIPSTLLNPIISATEGAQSVLVGIRNQIAPDARREDQEKWKGRVRGK